MTTLSRMARAEGVFFTVVKSFEEYEDLLTKIRILEATVKTMVKYDSETWVFQKTEADFYVFSRGICLWILLGTPLTDYIPNIRLYEKHGPILLSMALMR